MYAVYLTACGIISGLVINSVVRSVAAMSPAHKPATEPTWTVRECLDTAERLWDEVDRQRKALTEQKSAREADDAWSRFRVEWLQRKRDAESRCALDSKNRETTRYVYSRLERVMDLYTIHATQYAGEIGFTVDALRESLAQARKPPAKP